MKNCIAASLVLALTLLASVGLAAPKPSCCESCPTACCDAACCLASMGKTAHVVKAAGLRMAGLVHGKKSSNCCSTPCCNGGACCTTTACCLTTVKG